ncbi:MAG: hypothetical protein WC314_13415 [Vulcanimicrobiota bacterium]
MTTLLLYGASNLWLSRRAALTELRRRFSGSLQIGLAHGPGRSYGLKAGNLVMRYEPLHIVDFNFPDEGREKVAFVTDIGNDIAYSQPPGQVVEWVRRLIERLQKHGYRIIVGGIPTRSVALLHPFLFRVIAHLLYSGAPLDLKLLTRNLEEVENGVRELCCAKGMDYLELNPDWYSYDRFHLKGAACSVYWQSLLQDFPVKHSYDSKWSLAARRPLFPRKYWLMGRERRGAEQYQELVPQSTIRVR